MELAARETVGAVIEVKATSNEGCGAGVKKPPTHRKPNLAGRVHSIGAAPCGAFHGGKPGDRQPLGTGRCDTGGNRGLLLGLAPRGPPDRLAPLMIATGPLQLEVDKKYALRFIAVLALAAACCAGLVGSVIWIIGGL